MHFEIKENTGTKWIIVLDTTEEIAKTYFEKQFIEKSFQSNVPHCFKSFWLEIIEMKDNI